MKRAVQHLDANTNDELRVTYDPLKTIKIRYETSLGIKFLTHEPDYLDAICPIK